MSFTIAIIGRPNVGKSTLFNRLTGRRLALVDDTPGLTRDRREGRAKLGTLRFRVFDTAGFEDAEGRSLEARMRRQTEAAAKEADLVLLVIDAREGVSSLDREFARVLRRIGCRVLLLANKCEGKQGDEGLMEAWRLGLGDPAPLSAEHGEGLSDLYELLRQAEEKLQSADGYVSLEPIIEDEEPFDPDAEAPVEPDKPIRIAFVGRPNAGKSTLINGILNDDRFITGPEAGITRDSVTVAWTWRDREIRLVDTAGLRKRAKVQEKLERLSTMETTHSIRFADVVVLVMDPRDAFEKQDVQIANLALREGRGLVFAITKWDTVDNVSEARKEMEHQAESHLPHAKGTPVVPVSGETRKNLDKLMDACLKVHKDWSARIKTRDLNDWLQYTTQKHPPPAPDGKRIKPRYMAQMKTRPPTFVLIASRAESMPETYKRYLLNELRASFDLPGVPLRLVLKGQKNPYTDKE